MGTTLSISLRPTKLDDVIGQRAIITSIRAQFNSGRLPRAWMFSGPFGTGKTTLAYIVAVLLGVDPAIVEGSEINASVFNKVDDARDLVGKAEYEPLKAGGHKVFILDEVQRLTDAAQNALLKSLERKEGSTVWILCTTEPHKILEGIRDRCLSYRLHPLSNDDINALVRRAAKTIKLDEAQATGNLVPLLVSKNIRSPRVILNVVELFASGMSAEEAAQTPAEPPEYIEIVKATLSGNWTKTSELLQQHKNVDVQGLLGLLRYCLKTTLLKEPVGARATAAAECIVGLAQMNLIGDGATTAALLYKTARTMEKVKNQEEF